MNPWEILGAVLGWSLLGFLVLVVLVVAVGLTWAFVSAMVESSRKRKGKCKVTDRKDVHRK